MKKKSILIILFVALAIGIVSYKDSREYLLDSGTFLISFVFNPTKVGAIAPSSPFLAKESTKYVKTLAHPIRILEVGAGTGVFTKKIIEGLRGGDSLDVVELDPEFCEILKRKFGQNENVTIHCKSIIDMDEGKPYDLIVSGLPFNAFDSDFVQVILDKYKNLVKSGGVISYFEYMFLPKIKEFFLSKNGKKEFAKVRDVVDMFRNCFELETAKVWLNIPPAYVHHLKINK